MQRDLQALATVVNQLSTTRLLADASAKADTIINRAKEQAEMWNSMSISTITYVHCVLSYIHEDNETGSGNFDCKASFLVIYYLHAWSTFNVSNVDKNAVIKDPCRKGVSCGRFQRSNRSTYEHPVGWRNIDQSVEANLGGAWLGFAPPCCWYYRSI